MLTLLHYLPHILISGLVVLTLIVMFGDDGRKKRVPPERLRHLHYKWNDHNAHRD